MPAPYRVYHPDTESQVVGRDGKVHAGFKIITAGSDEELERLLKIGWKQVEA
jgi:hypothetical protein